jgi:MinD superfamily P-loop ATPase
MLDSLVIAIASGKGGTGKTTIATNLACSIARMGKTVQYIDCDVEEPNGHIFLKDAANAGSFANTVP